MAGSSWSDLYADDPNTSTSFRALGDRLIGDRPGLEVRRDPRTPPFGMEGNWFPHDVPDDNVGRAPDSERRGLPPSPAISGGLPLWAATPDQAVSPRSQLGDDTMLGTAMLNRYEGQPARGVMNSMSEDMIPNTSVRTVMHPNGLLKANGDKTFGMYLPGTQSIHLDASAPAYEQMTTYPHELAHAADNIRGLPMNQPAGPTHHADYVNFEPEMAQNLDATRAIEQGWPVNPAIMQRYPYLNKIKSQSSNRLASPWDFSDY